MCFSTQFSVHKRCNLSCPNAVLLDDTYQPEQEKRWVVVAPPGLYETTLLLAKASNPEQEKHIGSQIGGRVFRFLYTDNFWRDYNEMLAKGIEFCEKTQASRLWDGGCFQGFVWKPLGFVGVQRGSSNHKQN